MDTKPFEQILDVTSLLPVLSVRLPKSSHVYNMAIMYPNYGDQMKFYTLGKEVNEGSWILVTYAREDYGPEVNVCAPNNPTITKEIKDAFINTSLIDWSKPYSFPEIDRSISPMLFEISALIKGNPTEFTPCRMYVISTEDALKLDLGPNTPDIEVRSLNIDLKSGSQFMYDTCQRTAEGSMDYIQNLIRRNPSVGVFKDGKLISGAITCGNGLMGFLFTLEEFRKNKYGKLAMQSLMKEQALKGFSPCSAVEIINKVSNEFHLKVGMKFSHVMDFIIYERE